MISQDRYNKCKNLLRQLIEENILKYKQVVEPQEREVKTESFTYLAYEDIDPDEYGKQMIKQLHHRWRQQRRRRLTSLHNHLHLSGQSYL